MIQKYNFIFFQVLQILVYFPFIGKSHVYYIVHQTRNYVKMRNPKVLKTRPEFYKTRIYLEDSLLILKNIQTWDNYRLYSQDLANLVHENIGFHFKKVYQMFRFLTRFFARIKKILVSISNFIVSDTIWSEHTNRRNSGSSNCQEH